MVHCRSHEWILQPTTQIFLMTDSILTVLYCFKCKIPCSQLHVSSIYYLLKTWCGNSIQSKKVPKNSPQPSEWTFCLQWLYLHCGGYQDDHFLVCCRPGVDLYTIISFSNALCLDCSSPGIFTLHHWKGPWSREQLETLGKARLSCDLHDGVHPPGTFRFSTSHVLANASMFGLSGVINPCIFRHVPMQTHVGKYCRDLLEHKICCSYFGLGPDGIAQSAPSSFWGISEVWHISLSWLVRQRGLFRACNSQASLLLSQGFLVGHL